jgi:hypothetical protein
MQTCHTRFFRALTENFVMSAFGIFGLSQVNLKERTWSKVPRRRETQYVPMSVFVSMRWFYRTSRHTSRGLEDSPLPPWV